MGISGVVLCCVVCGAGLLLVVQPTENGSLYERSGLLRKALCNDMGKWYRMLCGAELHRAFALLGDRGGVWCDELLCGGSVDGGMGVSNAGVSGDVPCVACGCDADRKRAYSAFRLCCTLFL